MMPTIDLKAAEEVGQKQRKLEDEGVSIRLLGAPWNLCNM